MQQKCSLSDMRAKLEKNGSEQRCGTASDLSLISMNKLPAEFEVSLSFVTARALETVCARGNATMKSVIWGGVALGALTGALCAIGRDVSTVVVMGTVGAGFGAPVGAALSAIIMAANRKRRLVSDGNVGMSRNESRQNGHPYSPMLTADEWQECRQRFPFYAAGDTDPMAKTMTGWRDASDIHYTRDIAS